VGGEEIESYFYLSKVLRESSPNCVILMMSETAMKVKMTEKALRRGFQNARHAPEEGIVCVLPVHARGRGKDVLEEMVTNHQAGWAEYAATGTYHIVDEEAAIDFVEDNGGDVPFGVGE
jgi:hypothetical protein